MNRSQNLTPTDMLSLQRTVTLKARGEVSVIIIAHNYAQVFEVCDRVNLLQHGEITFDKYTSETSVTELTDLVVEEYRRSRTK